ncbi:SET domain-containing protein, partial [Aureobasidium melanogenum]
TVLYDLEPQGVVTVRFKEAESAALCAEAFNGRWFDKRKVIAYVPQHREDYAKSKGSGQDGLQDIDEDEPDDDDDEKERVAGSAVEGHRTLEAEKEKDPAAEAQNVQDGGLKTNAYEQVDNIYAHRIDDTGAEQYLIKWKHEILSDAVLSWHNLDDLVSVADLLQTYINNFVLSLKSGYGNGSLRLPSAEVTSLKRKSPHDESPSTRASSLDTSTSTSSIRPPRKLEVWNGVLLKKSGDIYPHALASGVQRIDATTVPTPEMLSAAKAHLADGVKQGRKFVRRQFLQQLASIPGPPVTFVNEVNKETPSLSFTYIQDYVLGEGASRDDADAVKMGCKKCRPDMGGNRGCEYTTKCDCLEFAAPDESRCKDDEQKEQFAAWISGEADSEGLPKRFPYKKDHVNDLFVLDTFYLDSRNAIYECNELCRCGSGCKNRLVQKGRKVPLEIFKTRGRGFGLRCPIDLKRGQYIDRYLGELITDGEADAREESGDFNKA